MELRFFSLYIFGAISKLPPARPRATAPTRYSIFTQYRTRLIKLFGNISVICGLSLTAVAVAIYAARFALTNRTVEIYVDINAVLGDLVKSQTRGGRLSRNLVAAMWLLAADFNISLWFGSVPSSSNVPDKPNRDKILLCPVKNLRAFRLLDEWLDCAINF